MTIESFQKNKITDDEIKELMPKVEQLKRVEINYTKRWKAILEKHGYDPELAYTMVDRIKSMNTRPEYVDRKSAAANDFM